VVFAEWLATGITGKVSLTEWEELNTSKSKSHLETGLKKTITEYTT